MDPDSINGEKGPGHRLGISVSVPIQGLGVGGQGPGTLPYNFSVRGKKYFLVFALLCFSEFFNVNACLFCTNEKKLPKIKKKKKRCLLG